MKRIFCIVFALCLLLTCSACGAGSYGVKTVMTLVEQEYSMAFRNNDPLYDYVTAALRTMAAEGKIAELSRKWLGDDAISFPKDADALTKLLEKGPIEPKTFIIGVDINSFPMAYTSGDAYWGYDIELATLVCERLGWTLQIQPIDKENVYIELSSGNIDCAWGGVVLDPADIEAEKYTQFGPYIHNDIVVAARQGSSVWNALKLSGKNMSMPATDEAMAALEAEGKLLKRLGQITRLVGGTVECFEYLYYGKCDAVLTDSTALLYYNSH